MIDSADLICVNKDMTTLLGLYNELLMAGKRADLVTLADRLRAERTKSFGLWLTERIKASTDVRTITGLFNKMAETLPPNLRVSRQHLNSLARATPSSSGGFSIPALETIIGIATALHAPVDEALEAAGYLAQTGAASNESTHRLIRLFTNMNEEQQKLTLNLAQVVWDTREANPALSEKEQQILDLYRKVDDSNQNLLLRLLALQVTPSHKEESKPVQPDWDAPELSKAQSAQQLKARSDSLPARKKTVIKQTIADVEKLSSDAEGLDKKEPESDTPHSTRTPSQASKRGME
jgi:hypothetical protein